MADVFISYARATGEQAQAAASALRSLGYSVWIDADLPAHRIYSSVIEEQLSKAKAALVIWSPEAARSEWVMSEANRAREESKLVQVSVAPIRLPMPFGSRLALVKAGLRLRFAVRRYAAIAAPRGSVIEQRVDVLPRLCPHQRCGRLERGGHA